MQPLPFTPKPGRLRRIVSLFIAATLIVSIGVPASYYLGETSYDERFAWRMFSGKRAERCRVQVIETRVEDGGRKTQVRLPLTRIIHKAWESGLRRLRPDIVDAFLASRCERTDARELLLVRQCIRADGSPKDNDEVRLTCPIKVRIP